MFGWRSEVRLILGVCMLGCLLGLLAAGCTSDPAGPVGAKLVENPLDGALQTMTITDLASYSALEIQGRSLDRQEVLYLGSQETGGGVTASAILANYDFGDVYDETFTPEVLVASNISSVKLQLLMLDYYATFQVPEDEKSTAEKIIPKYFDLLQLDEPFVPEDYPGPLPPAHIVDGWLPPPLHDQGNTVHIDIWEEQLLTWLADGDVVGLLIQEWDFQPSTPGLVGLSSRDMTHAQSQIDDFNVDVSLGPTIEVELIEPNLTLYIKPIADTSTFHSVVPAPADPADGVMLRTCLRNYPALRFDLSQLPPNVFINRAILTVVNDTETSFGPLESIVVSEFTDTSYLTPVDVFSLSQLESKVHLITGMTSLDPYLNETMSFNVTTAIQRFINGVYEGDRALVLSAGEVFFPSYDLTTVGPDFFFVRFNFFGTAADEELRPRLDITYSLIEDLQEVGQ